MSEPRAPYGDQPLDARAHIEDLWRRFVALQISHEDPNLHPNAHELHARMCFLAGLTGLAFRMHELWLTQGDHKLMEFRHASQDLQWELRGLMMGMRVEGGKAKGGEGDGGEKKPADAG